MLILRKEILYIPTCYWLTFSVLSFIQQKVNFLCVSAPRHGNVYEAWR